MKRSTVVDIIAIIFCILFFYTGISKFMDYDLSREQMALSPILEPFAGVLAWLLPLSEIVLSIIIFIPRTRLIGLYGSFIFMSGFTGYVIYILSYNKELPCTCGGFLQQLSWPQHLILNISFVVFAIIGLWFMKKEQYTLSRKKINTNFYFLL